MADPAHPAWRPSDEEELRVAVEGGLLEEREHLEVKRELPEGAGANKELARDLASLAVNGGRLVIGIEEGDEGPALAPVPLDGLAERIEQVALSRVDPPLPVRFHPVEADSGSGYLLVDVPASPLAPHMVDGRYWGRGDKTKHQLADGDVARLMERRRHWERDVDALIDAEITRDPIPEDHRASAHLFVLAEPVAAREDALAVLLGSADWRDQIRDLLINRPDFAGPAVDYAPSPSPYMNPARRPGGAALTNYLNQDRTPESSPSGRIDETKVLELEVYENGGLRLFCGRGSAVMREDTVVVFDTLVLDLVHYVIAASQVIAEHTGHFTGYDFAVALTGLRGAVSHERAQGLAPAPAPYTDDGYRQVTRASATEIATRPGTVAGRLLGPLMRSLDVADHPRVGQYLTDQ